MFIQLVPLIEIRPSKGREEKGKRKEAVKKKDGGSLIFQIRVKKLCKENILTCVY